MEDDNSCLLHINSAFKSLFLGQNNQVTKSSCEICLKLLIFDSECQDLNTSAISVILQSMLIPFDEQKDSVTRNISLCSECSKSFTTLTNLFTQLEELRCQFNELRRNLGQRVIRGTLQKNAEGWVKSVQKVEDIFPSRLGQNKLFGHDDKSDKISATQSTGADLEQEVESSLLNFNIQIKVEENGFKTAHSSSAETQNVVPNETPSESQATDETPRSKKHWAKLTDECRTCPKCFKKFLNRYYLRRHTQSVHRDASQPKLGCPHCTATFKRLDILKRHVKNKHQRILYTNGIQPREIRPKIPIQVNVAEPEIPQVSVNLKEENEEYILGDFGEEEEAKETSENNVVGVSEGEGSYSVLLFEEKMKTEVSQNQESMPVDIADDVEREETELNVNQEPLPQAPPKPQYHQVSFNTDRYWKRLTDECITCKDCGKKFKNRYYLRRHVNSVHEDESSRQMFPCPQCSATYKRKDLLKRHLDRQHQE